MLHPTINTAETLLLTIGARRHWLSEDARGKLPSGNSDQQPPSHKKHSIIPTSLLIALKYHKPRRSVQNDDVVA